MATQKEMLEAVLTNLTVLAGRIDTLEGKTTGSVKVKAKSKGKKAKRSPLQGLAQSDLPAAVCQWISETGHALWKDSDEETRKGLAAQVPTFGTTGRTKASTYTLIRDLGFDPKVKDQVQSVGKAYYEVVANGALVFGKWGALLKTDHDKWTRYQIGTSRSLQRQQAWLDDNACYKA